MGQVEGKMSIHTRGAGGVQHGLVSGPKASLYWLSHLPPGRSGLASGNLSGLCIKELFKDTTASSTPASTRAPFLDRPGTENTEKPEPQRHGARA